MKQLLFVCLALLFSASMASAGSWRKIKMHPTGGCNPGTSGYAVVTAEDDGAGLITIKCSGCGDLSCSDAIITQAANLMFGYADSQIAGGTLTGSYTEPTSGYHVDWTATDVFDATENVTAP